MDPRCKGMPLSSFILKPMQRVTRYPLIIKNVSTHLAFSSSGMLSQDFRDPGSWASSPASTPGICCVEIIYQYQGVWVICLVTQIEKLFIVKRANDAQPSALRPSGKWELILGSFLNAGVMPSSLARKRKKYNSYHPSSESHCEILCWH